jgi:hypothetical protein
MEGNNVGGIVLKFGGFKICSKMEFKDFQLCS